MTRGGAPDRGHVAHSGGQNGQICVPPVAVGIEPT